MRADSDRLWTVSQEVFDPAAGGWGEAEGQQFVYQVQGSMECDGYGVICGSVRPECELVVVHG